MSCLVVKCALIVQCINLELSTPTFINHINHMVRATGETVDKVYTFEDILKKDDHVDFIKVMN